MSNYDKDSKLFVGLLIGGAVGLGALTIFLATRKEKVPLSRIGETILRVGEILGEHHVDEPAPVKRMEKEIHSHQHCITEVMDWVATGLHLWKKFKN